MNSFTDNKIRHLEMIQNTINRMSNNSFLLKGWTVVLVSAIFVLGTKDSEIQFFFLACFPVLAFWLLDGYYLWQERLFRKLYDKVRSTRDEDIDFSMETSSVAKDVESWLQVVFSKTLVIFHGVIIGIMIIVMLLIVCIR